MLATESSCAGTGQPVPQPPMAPEPTALQPTALPPLADGTAELSVQEPEPIVKIFQGLADGPAEHREHRVQELEAMLRRIVIYKGR